MMGAVTALWKHTGKASHPKSDRLEKASKRRSPKKTKTTWRISRSWPGRMGISVPGTIANLGNGRKEKGTKKRVREKVWKGRRRKWRKQQREERNVVLFYLPWNTSCFGRWPYLESQIVKGPLLPIWFRGPAFIPSDRIIGYCRVEKGFQYQVLPFLFYKYKTWGPQKLVITILYLSFYKAFSPLLSLNSSPMKQHHSFLNISGNWGSKGISGKAGSQASGVISNSYSATHGSSTEVTPLGTEPPVDLILHPKFHPKVKSVLTPDTDWPLLIIPLLPYDSFTNSMGDPKIIGVYLVLFSFGIKL